MLATVLYLAQSTPGANDGGSTDVVTIVYILTSISLIIGFIVGTYKYVQRQKKKWTEEGVTRQRQAQAVADNTAMMSKLSGLTEKNTDAIEKLTIKFGDFAVSVRTELNVFGDRIGKLETWRNNQNNGRGT
jgi:K+/H+ antiporter YhaU regulatory subunit KhtT